MRIILWSCLLFVLSNCGDTTKKGTSAVQGGLPSITLEEIQMLYAQADYVDFIFYNLNFNTSVNTKKEVQGVVRFVDKSQPNPNFTCPTIGRIIFQKNGEILIEADMHIDKDCSHFVFFKDGKKVYANNITEQGKFHFKRMLSAKIN